MTSGVSTAAPAQQPAQQPATNDTKSVTLVTGDRVVVQNGTPTAIIRAAGRENVPFSWYRHGESTYVLPKDAIGLIGNDKVDRRLFDVAGLIKAGYDDSKRTTTPLLVSQPAGVQVTKALPGTELKAAEAPRTAASWEALTGTGSKVWLDGMRQTSLDKSTAQIGAPAAWQAGYTGKGVKVAVLDTGVDANHPDLKGKELVEKNFTPDPDNTDKIGHGTHVASTIASGDATFRGVAPDAQLLDGKVCFDFGCPESSILAGMQWAAEQGADVVNMSLGGGDTAEVDPLENAVNKLSAQYGTLFAIAAGNSGAFAPVSSPSTAEAALSVGAVNRDDSLAEFSSRGPRTGDAGLKPDLTAPGVGIVAAKAGTTERFAASGTSMATPHAAGAAALLAQQHPDWTGAQIKATLVASAKPNATNTAYEQGAGRIDLAKAITQTVTTDPVSVGLGHHAWPHNDDQPVSKQLTYRNAGTTAVTLDLSIDAKAPAGMFTVTPAQLTVPAGGTATATVTGDSRVGTEDKAFSGAVVARAGQAGLRTAIGLQREVESYEVTINRTGRDGKPSPTADAIILGLDNNTFAFVPPKADGTAKLRLPKGKYYSDSIGGTPGALDFLAYADVNVTGAITLDYDARKGKAVSISGPDATAKPTNALLTITRTEGQRGAGSGVMLPSFEGFQTAGLGPKLTPEQFVARFIAGFAAEDGARHVYAFEEFGILPAGFTKKVEKKDLAEVTTKVGPVLDGKKALYGIGAIFPNGGGGALLETKAPGTVKNFLTGPKSVQWSGLFFQLPADKPMPDVVLSAPLKTYKAGKKYSERINFAVFGPDVTKEFANIGRLGDNIGISVPMHADQVDGSGNTYGFDTAFTKLYRDGKLIGETPFPSNGFFQNVPAGKATFKVDSEVTRSVSEVSTKVATSWTFKSDTVPGNTFAPQALATVRFAPRLSDDNSAKAGKLLRVPLQVRQSASPDNGKIREVLVEASFDDGKTWKKVPVVGGCALVHNPGKAGFASLRASGVDTKGNSFSVTIVRAYKIA